MKGFSTVFSFTLRSQLHSRGYRVITILLTVLCLLLPAGIMTAMEAFRTNDSAAPEADAGTNLSAIETVYYVDRSQGLPADLGQLNGPEDAIAYASCADEDGAISAAAQNPESLILLLDGDADGFRMQLLLPDDSALTQEELDAFRLYLENSYPAILSQKAGLDAAAIGGAEAPITAEVVTAESGEAEEADGTEADPFAGLRTALSFALPYLNIMLLYFLVLFHGQEVATSVVSEKASKLMDTMLVSVQPGAMIFGKVFAIALSSILQLFFWLASLIASFALGAVCVRAINPASDMVLLQFLSGVGKLTGLFSVPGLILGFLLIMAGFLLYCAMASVGGSLAGKAEDLASTNGFFTMILVISFFFVLFSGVMSGGMADGLTAYDLVPFTAVLVTPSRILIGSLTLLEGTVSLLLTLLLSAICLWLAGRIYVMLSLYKGNPPKLKALLSMLRQK